MQNYLIYLNNEYYTYVKADSVYVAIAKAVNASPQLKINKITIYKENNQGEFSLIEN